MISKDQVEQLQNGTVLDSEGNKVGSVGAVYFDDQTDQPDWMTVKTGLFGTKEPFVPLSQARIEGGQVRLPFPKDMVKDAPRIDAEEHLDIEQERELYRYYGLDYDQGGLSDRGDRGGAVGETDLDDQRGGPGYDTSGPTTDEAMTRSEEQLNVGTQRQQAGRARLRKYVVTEQQTVTVPVTREKAVLETEPITDANRDDAVAGPAISDEEHEVTLHEEQVVVDKQAVPVERVKLGTETVTEDREVTEEVRKERIEADGDIEGKDF